MRNRIRHRSLINTHIFNIYIEKLITLLPASKLGYHIGTKLANSFAYANDLAILAPTACAFNMLMYVCYDFSSKFFIELSARKTVVLRVKPPFHTTEIKPCGY